MADSKIARTWVFCCLSIALILAESISEGGYHSQNSEYPDSGSQDEVREGSAVAPGSRSLDPDVSDQLEANGWLDVIPGTPGKDYPNYDKIPETSFTCDGKTVGGYYADIEARCQVFHVCDTGGLKSTFVCPSGSIFNQKYLVCAWWYDFECDDATDLYSLNEKLNRGGTGSGPGGPGWLEENIENVQNYDSQVFPERENPDLSLAGTGEGGPGYARAGSKGYQSNAEDEGDPEERNVGGTRERNSNRKNPESPESVENGEELHEEVGLSDDFRMRNNPAVNSGINYRSKDSKSDNFRHGNDEGRGRGNGFNESRNSRVGDSDDLKLPDKNPSTNLNRGRTSPSSPGSNDNGNGIRGVIGEGTRPRVVQGRQRNSGGSPGGLGNGYRRPGRSRELPGSDRIGIGIAIAPGERRTPVDDEGDERFSVVNSRADNAKSTIIRRTDEGDEQRAEIDSRDNRLLDNEKYSEMNDRYNRQGPRDHRDKNVETNYSDDHLVGIVPGDESQPDGKNLRLVKKEKRRYLPIL